MTKDRIYTIDTGEGFVEVDPDRPGPRPLQGPGDALAAHLDGLAWLLTPAAASHFDTLYQHMNRSVWLPDRVTQAAGSQALLYTALNANSTTYVSEEMLSLVRAIAPELAEGHLHLMDVPDNAGVILFGGQGLPHPFGRRDTVDDFVAWRGVAYRTVGKGAQVDEVVPSPRVRGKEIVLSFTLDSKGENEAVIEQIREQGGVLLWPLYDARLYLTAPTSWAGLGSPPFLPMLLTAVPFGSVPAFRDDEPHSEFTVGRSLLLGLWRLMWQRILKPEEWTPNRQARRAADRLFASRKPFAVDGETYKVVHLRRYEGEYGTEPIPRGPHAPMAYRVIVRGHVRDQHYPSLGPARNDDGTWNEASHRRIWIDPHIRGPEHAPLVLKHSLSAVVR